MKRLILVAIVLTVVLLSLAACGGAPTPVPTLPPPPTFPPRPTNVPPTPTAFQPSATPVPPTAAPQATATTPPTVSAAQLTQAPTVGASTATAVPATAIPPTETTAPASASPTPAISPGLYVTSLRLDPVQPAHRVNTSMYVSFLNTATGDQNVRWVVYVFRADNPARPIAQSPVNQAAFRPGAPPEQDSLIKFNLGATGNNTDFLFARVDILDINNKGTDLPGTDGKTFERGFTVSQ